MKTIFADTFYWIALFDPRDNWHQKVKDVSKSIGKAQIVTTDSVLVEFVNFFSARGRHLRSAAVEAVKKAINHPHVQVLPQSRELLLAGLTLFDSRLDKNYSLIDCISMVAMKSRGLTEVLTADQHFKQEGLSLLL